jgi:hypothetical protein
MSKRPAHEIRFGFVKAAIWENQTKGGLQFKVTIVRLFKDGDAWRESTRFGRDDLPLVAKAADLAHTWIYQHGHRPAIANGAPK